LAAALGVIARLPAGPASPSVAGGAGNAFSAALHTIAIIGALLHVGAALLTGRFSSDCR